MYLDYFGLNEPPFRITPHTEFFFAGGNRGATLDALLYAITHDEGIVKVSGEVGSGKTMLCRVLMERLPASVTIIYLANPSLSRDDILYAIADELRLTIPADARAAMVLRTLQDHLIQSHGEGRQVVVLIDEAHAMPADTLEEIRLLSNLESNRHKLLQLVLFGQPELNDVLARTDMRQLKERITHNFALEPLILSDISSYLDFRLRAAGYKGPNLFTPKAIQLIAKTSLGLTRRINILADKCLLAAFSKNSHQIGIQEVRAAVRDCDFSSATGKARSNAGMPTRVIGSLVLVAILVVIAITILYKNERGEAPPITAAPQVSNSLPSTSTPTLATATPSPTTPPASSNLTLNSQTTTPADSTQTTSKLKVTTTGASESLPEGTGPLTRRFVTEGERWLETADDGHWFLQLMASDGNHPEAIEAFLQRVAKSGISVEQVRAYFVDTDNIRRFGVIYGEFDSRTAASAELKSLPPAIRASRPFPRQVIQLR